MLSGDPPSGVVTVTLTAPVPAGLVTVRMVADMTVKSVAGLAPKYTAVAPVKLVPVTVTPVPPAAGPKAGLLIAVTVGAGS